ncbi:MAG: hypothetical protein MIO90_02655 [Methanomassiliicoccales archaeon]|nr:hypothetical protein [Methanomassiliicoccales archaeon]
MQIKSIETTAIESKRFSKTGEKMVNIKIENNSAITQVSKGEGDISYIDFRFTANYTGLGYIKIEGHITVSDLGEKMMDDWRRTNNLPVEDANIVHNAVVSNCMITALIIAREIKLPAPMPIPRINMQKKPEIRPSDGVEVA